MTDTKPTPRTDAAVVHREYILREMDIYSHKFVLADFARTLERELAAIKSQPVPVEPVAWKYSLVVDGQTVDEKSTHVNWNPEYQPFGRRGADHIGDVSKTPLYGPEVLTALQVARDDVNQMRLKAGYWENEAKRYCGNADYWRELAKKDGQERDAAIDLCDQRVLEAEKQLQVAQQERDDALMLANSVNTYDAVTLQRAEKAEAELTALRLELARLDGEIPYGN